MATRKSEEKYIRSLKRKLWESQGREAKLREALKVATDAFEARNEAHFPCVPLPASTPKRWRKKLDPSDSDVAEWEELVAMLREVYEKERGD